MRESDIVIAVVGLLTPFLHIDIGREKAGGKAFPFPESGTYFF
jgi:hypothetical protein